jgi:hypothetical protein
MYMLHSGQNEYQRSASLKHQDNAILKQDKGKDCAIDLKHDEGSGPLYSNSHTYAYIGTSSLGSTADLAAILLQSVVIGTPASTSKTVMVDFACFSAQLTISIATRESIP